MQRVVILGVPIDAVTRSEALARMRAMLASGTQHHVMTPNNEMLVLASRDASFRALLHRTALNLPDSTGLLWAARWTGQRLPERVTGVDTVHALSGVLDASTPVYLLGGAEGIAWRAGAALRAAHPALRIVGTYAGSPREEDAKGIVDRINASHAQLLLVAYGAPAQDLWIDAHMKDLTSVKVAIGIGGTFDFLAGAVQRAPQWMQRAGLEWLYRFVQQPSRWRRMWTAVIVFPFLVLTHGASPPRTRTTPSRLS